MSKREKQRTQEDVAIHKEAVRLRKMTDQQLVEEFRRAGESMEAPAGRNSGPNLATENREAKDTNGVKILLNELSEGKCKGVKGATVYKITEFASGLGLI